MRAKKVYENISFERGKDPKTAMGIGDWSIKRALLDEETWEPGSMEYDAGKEWWENGGIPEEFKNEIGYSGDPNDFASFDEDYYLENIAPEWIDQKEFYDGFNPIEERRKSPNTNGWGTFIWQKGELEDGTIVYKYIDGMGSGYIARREDLKGDK